MINFIKVSIFSLLMVGGFWGFSNFGIPQIKPEPPPVEAKLDLGAMPMDQFIALGASAPGAGIAGISTVTSAPPESCR